MNYKSLKLTNAFKQINVKCKLNISKLLCIAMYGNIQTKYTSLIHMDRFSLCQLGKASHVKTSFAKMCKITPYPYENWLYN